jgi:DNA repair photolyase
MALIPGVPAPNLAPRMGAAVVRERAGVAYRELETRSLLNRCSSERMPFEWTVNPYRGCAMGCRYCYATYTHEYLGKNVPESFHESVFVKTGGAEETSRRLSLVVRRGESIALGTATDPYQPGETEWNVTRRFLEQVAALRGVRLSITTKGAGILRDVELLRSIHARSRLTIHVSLISLDAMLLRDVEPLAPPPEVRLRVIERLIAAGLDTLLSIAPVLPGLTDAEADLERLLVRAKSVGVKAVAYVPLFLRSPTREKYLRWIETAHPRYLEAYRRAYSHGAYLGRGYRERLRATMSRLRLRHGLASGWEERPVRRARSEQLRLWG